MYETMYELRLCYQDSVKLGIDVNEFNKLTNKGKLERILKNLIETKKEIFTKNNLGLDKKDLEYLYNKKTTLEHIVTKFSSNLIRHYFDFIELNKKYMSDSKIDFVNYIRSKDMVIKKAELSSNKEAFKFSVVVNYEHFYILVPYAILSYRDSTSKLNWTIKEMKKKIEVTNKEEKRPCLVNPIITTNFSEDELNTIYAKAVEDEYIERLKDGLSGKYNESGDVKIPFKHYDFISKKFNFNPREIDIDEIDREIKYAEKIIFINNKLSELDWGDGPYINFSMKHKMNYGSMKVIKETLEMYKELYKEKIETLKTQYNKYCGEESVVDQFKRLSKNIVVRKELEEAVNYAFRGYLCEYDGFDVFKPMSESDKDKLFNEFMNKLWIK